VGVRGSFREYFLFLAGGFDDSEAGSEMLLLVIRVRLDVPWSILASEGFDDPGRALLLLVPCTSEREESIVIQAD
jgi:hypothetical protein